MPDSEDANATESTKPDTLPPVPRQSSWSDIITGWGHLMRFCFAILFLGVLTVGAIVIVFGGLPGDLKIDAGQTALVFYKGGKEQAATLLLPATEEWLDTHLKVTADRKIAVSASGHVNLAVHHAIEWAQEKDGRPKVGVWVGPDGRAQYYRPIDECRRPLLIDPKQPYGAVLAYVQAQGSPAPSPENPRPAGVFYIGEGTLLNDPKDSKVLEGELFLTVNDAIVTAKDPSARQIYACTEQALKQSYKKKTSVKKKLKEWDSFVNAQFWDALFQDNAGEFLVRIAFEKR